MARMKIDCEPTIAGDITIGGPGHYSINIGRLIDSGHKRAVCFDADNNFVVLEVGKRGSGKSFGLGAAMEAFATQEESSTIARHGTNRRGVLLLDPLDVHWTAIYPVTSEGSPHMGQQYKLLERWPEIKVESINVDVYMPAGSRRPGDPSAFVDYYLPVSDLSAEDFALLYGANLMSDPAGMLLAELYDDVTRLGYSVAGNDVPSRPNFGLQDLIDCVQADDIQANYQASTLRAVRQRLLSWQRDPLFQRATGTPVTQLVQSGRLSILCLNRLSDDMREVVTSVVVRKIKAERTRASQMERRRAFDPSAPPAGQLEMPRTILAIDEAQMILPASGGGHARSAIESYVLEGRNFGLSIWMATQRPKGAISGDAKSQLDTLIVHKLSTADDVSAVTGLLQSSTPSSIKFNGRRVDVEELIRNLEVGAALVSSGHDNANRSFVMEVRPRVVAHGGRAF
jgi:hypothetical protein